MILTKEQLTVEKRTIVLSSTDDIFKDTDYADKEFTITIKELDRATAINVMIDSSEISGDDPENIIIKSNSGKTSKEKFIASIVAWSGFKDEDGNDIPCNREVKEAIWDGDGFDTLIAAVQSKIYEFDKKGIAEGNKKKAIKKKS